MRIHAQKMCMRAQKKLRGLTPAHSAVRLEREQEENTTMGYTAALVAITAFLLLIDAPLTKTGASAGNARCAASCTNWCTKNFPMKNITACTQQCQLKHCR